MIAHIVIASRGGRDAKSRLAGCLRPDQRSDLVAAMLADMLHALEVRPAGQVVHVTTPTPALARIAARAGALVTLEPDSGDLNGAFDSCRRWIAAASPGAPLVLLPGDLPFLDVWELHPGIAAAAQGRVALAPAAADGGTGAIVAPAGCGLALAYGPNSFQKHLAAAAALRLEVEMMEAPGLARDVDRPEDLDRVMADGRGHAAALLRAWKVAA